MATMTQAAKKIDTYRDVINKGKEKIMADDFSCVVYTYESDKGDPCAIGYKGRRKKPTFCFRYKSTTSRENEILDWMHGVSLEKTNKNTQGVSRLLEVGDVLSTCWGYDQTNVEFYKVLELVGKASVKIVEISREMIATGDMEGKVIPLPNSEKGEPFTKRTCKHSGNSVSIDSRITASILAPKIVAGCKIYPASYVSSYA